MRYWVTDSILLKKLDLAESRLLNSEAMLPMIKAYMDAPISITIMASIYLNPTMVICGEKIECNIALTVTSTKIVMSQPTLNLEYSLITISYKIIQLLSSR